MSDTEHARLAAIEREFLDMGATGEMVERYVLASSSRLGSATEWPRHNGTMLHIPPGTVPHEEYIAKLEDLVDDIRNARKTATAAERAIEDHKAANATTTHDRQKSIAIYEHQVIAPKIKVHALFLHLTKFRPINAAEYFKRLDALINEKIEILVNIRIVEGSNLM